MTVPPARPPAGTRGPGTFPPGQAADPLAASRGGGTAPGGRALGPTPCGAAGEAQERAAAELAALWSAVGVLAGLTPARPEPRDAVFD